jgi:O-antigen ligase
MIGLIFVGSLIWMGSIGGLLLANIFYFPFLIKHGFRISSYRKNGGAFISYLLFIIWVSFSTVVYVIEFGIADFRFLYKYLFAFQYLIILVKCNFSGYHFERLLYCLVICFCLYFIALFVYLAYGGGCYLDCLNKSWAYDYVPGFPNSLPLVLIFALWVSFRRNFGLIGKILILAAVYLTASRGAQVMSAVVVLYFLMTKLKFSKVYVNSILMLFILILAVLFLIFMSEFVNFDPFYSYFYDIDRIDLYQYAFEFIKNRPLIGYGGNTLEQLRDVPVNYQPIFLWEHTHNWVLELILRYGVVGFLLFLFYLIFIFKRIVGAELKFMFVIYVTYALLQTFMQNFIFIFILSYIANGSGVSLGIERGKYVS